LDRELAKKHWNSAAPGWAKWEPVIGRWLRKSTEAMLDAAAVAPGSSVVDIACGAGDQSLTAARRVGNEGRVLATDISEEMIGFVEEQARAADLDNLTARSCAAEDLETENAAFDAAICRLGLMLIPNPHGIAGSILTILRPSGRFGAVVIGPPEHNPFLAEPLKILRRHANKAPPPPGAPGIFALANAGQLSTLLRDAGFTDVSVKTIDENLDMDSAEDAMQMIKEAFGVYRAIIGDQPARTQEDAWAEVLDFLKRFEGAYGLRVTSQFHVASGAKPSRS
jgi:ubiquinone/menaquinone biosynthesis C-methylase UbiE